MVFGSCHTPTTERSLERWQALAQSRDYDLMLLMGDQIYEHGLEGDKEEAWFKEYVKRYHQYWTYKPIREVLRRTPTYMTLDDHEIIDDWGSPSPSDGIIQTMNAVAPAVRRRVNGAIRAYHAFQHAHNPGGTNPSSPIYYSFHRVPAAFFVADSRTVRGTEVRNDPTESFAILGKEQFAAMEEWARSREIQQADVIFFIAAVPLALVSLAELERFNQELEEALASAVGTGAALLDAWVAGPVVGNGIGYISGREIVGEAFEWQVVEEDLSTTYNMDDQWISEHNQSDLTHVLDLLLELANELRPRAIFVLSGDSHMGAMHVFGSRKPEHRRNTASYQLISSPISRESPAEELIERYNKGIRQAPVHEMLKSLSEDAIASSVADRTPDEMGIRFPLDHHANQESSNKAQLLGLRATRNFGLIELEHVRDDKRVYRFRVSIRGQVASLAYDNRARLRRSARDPSGHTT
ncbi:MAG: alkaline phosphatase D family protein [Rubrobacter sp.]|nr:alkaline phosphatase D family protein [Rubrobacter sp.]